MSQIVPQNTASTQGARHETVQPWHFLTVSGQKLSTGNTQTVTSSEASPGSPWIGDWEMTRDEGFVRVLTVLDASDASVSGTFTFEFSETGAEVALGLAPISETRPIGDFDTVRDFNLLNAGAYYRTAFEPDVALGAESVSVTTTYRRTNDGQFVRLANQELEEANAAMGSTFAFLKAFDSDTGKSVNVRPNAFEDLLATSRGSNLDIGNSSTTPLASGEEFTGEWVDTDTVSSLLPFAFGLAQIPTIELQWSTDGVDPDTDILATTNLFTTEQETAGFFIYLDALTTMIRRYVRLHLINGNTAQTTGLYAHALWRYHGGSVPWTLGALEDTLSTLSTALLTRSVSAGVDPDDDFINSRVGGVHSGNTTASGLKGNTGAEDHIFRGDWFEWQEGFVGLVTTLESDVTGTYFVDFSTFSGTPVSSGDEFVDQSLEIDYDPAVTPVLRRVVPVQSRWARSRYVNGVTGQAEFSLTTAFLTTATPLALQTIGTVPTINNMAGMVDSVIAVKKDGASDFTRLTATAGTDGKFGVHTHITGVQDDVPIRPATSGITNHVTVSETASQLDTTKIANRKAIKIVNDPDGEDVLLAFDSSNVRTTGEFLAAGASAVFGVSEVVNIFAITKSTTGGSPTTSELDGATASGTATSPSDALSSNDTRATIDAVGEDIVVEDFSHTLTDTVSMVRIGVEARKEPSTSDTVAHEETETGTAGDTTNVTSATVTSVAGHVYLAVVSRKNTSAVVSSISGLGLTWAQIEDVADDEGDSRISIWRGTGTPTGDGTVTASFSEAATNSCIAVSRFSGSDGLTDSTSFTVAGDSSSYSGSVTGEASGIIYVGVSMANRTHAATDGSTEQAEVSNGSGGNTASLAVTTNAASGGSNAFSGNFSGSAGWTGVAVALSPSSTDPILEVAWQEEGVPGATIETITLSSEIDLNQYVDITTDTTWTNAVISGTRIVVTGDTIGVPDAQVDRVFLEITEQAGTTSTVSVTQVGLDEEL